MYELLQNVASDIKVSNVLVRNSVGMREYFDRAD